jgi:hypothetical protein
MRPIAALSLLVTSSILLGNCSSAKKSEVEEWYAPAPRAIARDLFALPEIASLPVQASARDRAINMVVAAPAVPLGRDEASSLAGKTLPDGTHYLLRGLCLGCEGGRFRTYTDGQRVLVANHSLAGPKVKPRRWPVIASLDRKPEIVYVAYSAAQ